MLQQGGPACLGSTCLNQFGPSTDLTSSILNYIFSAQTISVSSGAWKSGSVSDLVYFVAATERLAPGGTARFQVAFSDEDKTGTTATRWNWSIALAHTGGEYVIAQRTTDSVGNSGDIWNVQIPNLPTGYTWTRKLDGTIKARLTVSTVDSDSFPHQIYREISFAESGEIGPVVNYMTLAKRSVVTDVTLRSSQIGVALYLAKAAYSSDYSHYVKLSYALVGDPSMSIWTQVPRTLNNVEIARDIDASGTKLRINAEDGSTICAMSESGNGYFQVAHFVKDAVFANVQSSDYPIIITVTKENCIPYQTKISVVNNSISFNGDLGLESVSRPIPFKVSSSNVNKGNNFDVQGGDGADKSHAIHLDVATALDISLCSSTTNFDTKLEVFKSDRTTTGYFSDDDNSCTCNSLFSTLRGVSLQPGDYYIVVDGYNGAQGNFELSVDYTKNSNLLIQSLPFYHEGSTVNKPNNWDVQLGDGPDEAYNLVLQHPSCIDVTTCASRTNYDTKLEIFRSDSNKTTGFYNDDAACSYRNNTSTLSAIHLPAGAYRIVVDGFNGNVGDYGLSVRYHPDFVIPSIPYVNSSTTAGAINDWDVMYSDGEDHCYQIDLNQATSLDISLCDPSTNFDTKLEVFNEDGSPTGFYNDDNCGTKSILRDVVLSPGRYFIVVDGFSGATGNYKISVTSGSGLKKQQLANESLQNLRDNGFLMNSKNTLDEQLTLELTKTSNELSKKQSQINIEENTDYPRISYIYDLQKQFFNGKIEHFTSIIQEPSEDELIANAAYEKSKMSKILIPHSLEVSGKKIGNSIQFTYSLPEKIQADILIFNLLGRNVERIPIGVKDAGIYKVNWTSGPEASFISSGFYLCQLRTPKNKTNMRLISR